MSTIHRRNSQRLASALDALTSDLDITASEVEVNENIASMTPEEYVKQDVQGRDYDPIAYLGEEDEEKPAEEGEEEVEEVEDDEDDDFQAAFRQAMSEAEEDEEDEDNRQGEILQGDPGVDEVGSQATYDTEDVVKLGPDYGVDFDGDDRLQDIRNVPGRSQKQARIKKLIARIERAANHLENDGRKKLSLAYRLDIVCNNLQKKYSIK